MDEAFSKSRLWNLPFVLLLYRGIPSAFFICSLEYIAPEKQSFWCVDDFGARLHNNSDQCHSNFLNGSDQSSCTTWNYEGARTFISEFDAVCEREWFRAWAQSALMIGMMLGNLFFSHVSDWYGRRTICLLSHLCILCGGVACALAPSFQLWIILRIIMALGLGGNQNGPLTLSMESSNPQHRALLAFADAFGWVVGMSMLPIFPLFISDWRYLQLAISASTIPMLTMSWFVDESPRWLISKRKTEHAKKVILKILAKNQVAESKYDVDAVISRCLQEHQKASTEAKASFVDLFKTRRRAFTTMSFYIMYPINILVYYNLLYAIWATDTGALFSNLLWAGLFEAPTLLLVFLLVKHFNRKVLHVAMFLPGVLCCGYLSLCPNVNTIIKLILLTIAKMGVQIGFSVLGVHVNEIYPTKVRAIALGTCITVSRLGAIAAPFSHKQKIINENILNSMSCLIAIFLVTPVKETFGRPLPDEFEDDREEKSISSLDRSENIHLLLEHGDHDGMNS